MRMFDTTDNRHERDDRLYIYIYLDCQSAIEIDYIYKSSVTDSCHPCCGTEEQAAGNLKRTAAKLE